jgi:hypothetical protein
MPALVIESVIGNVEVFAHSDDDQKEYQTLHPLIAESEEVLEEKEESTSENDHDDDVMDVHDEIADVLPTGNKEHETATDSTEEENELGEVEFFNVTMC